MDSVVIIVPAPAVLCTIKGGQVAVPWAASLKPIQGVWLGVVRLLVPTVNVLLRRAVDAGLPMCGHRFAGHVHAVSESTLNAAAIDAFNARRLWQRDGSVHDGFRILTHILNVWSVSVLCIQRG